MDAIARAKVPEIAPGYKEKTKPTPQATPGINSVRASAGNPGEVEHVVRQAARKYGIDENHFVSIAMCESTMNPNAVNRSYYENGHPSGLFQHLSGYYPARAAKYGYSPDVFDAYSNANVTAAMWRDGMSYLWQCQ